VAPELPFQSRLGRTDLNGPGRPATAGEIIIEEDTEIVSEIA
jgi:hypothetical protein